MMEGAEFELNSKLSKYICILIVFVMEDGATFW